MTYNAGRQSSTHADWRRAGLSGSRATMRTEHGFGGSRPNRSLKSTDATRRRVRRGNEARPVSERGSPRGHRPTAKQRRRLATAPHTELAQNAVNVILHRRELDVQLPRDLFVRFA